MEKNPTSTNIDAGQEQNSSTQEDVQLAGKVLVVDDCKSNRSLMAMILKKFGILEVEFAEDGKVAIEKAQSEEVDIVLMDMQMPNIDGFEATRILREKGLEVPIIACTASIAESYAGECVDAGCNEYLCKPFKHKEFYNVLSKYLDKQGPIESKYSNDHEEVVKVVVEYLNKLGPKVAALKEHLQNGNIQGAREVNHQLKCGKLFGYPQITEIGKKITEHVLENQIEQALSLVDELETVTSQAVAGQSDLMKKLC